MTVGGAKTRYFLLFLDLNPLSTASLSSDPSLFFIVPACQLQIALECSIRSRETTFKKLGVYDYG